MDYICPSHRDMWLMVCSECSFMIMSEPFERILEKVISETPPGMVLISPGKFIMGSDEGEPNCSPAHVRHIKGYYIDEKPVTNAEYKKFKPDHVIKPGYENEPVTGVTWINAKSYAEWAGKRLPTEVEWEKAMRGVDGSMYPWGDEVPDDAGHSLDEFSSIISRLSKSPFGVSEGVGGIQEWVDDWYLPYGNSAYQDQAFGKSHKVLRGGNWAPFQPLTVCDRQYALPDERVPTAGFRCVKDTSVLLDFDISEERKKEQSRINALIEQLEIEKAAKKVTSDQDKIVLHDQRITELEEAIEKIKQESKEKAAKELEPSTGRKVQYKLSAFWESLVKVSGSKQDIAIRYAQILIALLIIVLFFANVFAREKVVFSVQHDDVNLIAISDVNGRNYQILKELGEAYYPDISPDGKYIVFSSDRDDHNDIYLATASGNVIRNISNDPSNDTKPRFMPDGRIMWYSDRANQNNLYTSNRMGSDVRLIPIPGGEFGDYDVSPDGNTIVFCLKVQNKWRIYLRTENSTDLISDPEWNFRNPTFTPNGKRILFSTNKTGNYELAYMNLDGSDIQQVTYTLGDEIGGTSFSRNGRWIFARYLPHGSLSEEKQIHKMRWNGTARRAFEAENISSDASSALWGFKRHIAKIAYPSYNVAPLSWKHTIEPETGVDILLEAHTRWFRTGVPIREGDLLNLSSVGQWRNSRGETPWTSTQGYSDILAPQAILPERPLGMLIGRIGNSPPFAISTRQTFISDYEGELQVMMNSIGTLSHNEGIITLNVKLSSNDEITLRRLTSFETLKYFGLDDGRRSGTPPESVINRVRINLLHLSLGNLLDPVETIIENSRSGRAILLEPSTLYHVRPNQLDRTLSEFKKSYEDQPIPKFAFFLPSNLSEYSEASMPQIVNALKKNFPGYPLISDIKTDDVLKSQFSIHYLNQFDCLIIDLPPEINASDSLTPLHDLPTKVETPLDRMRTYMPHMPLMVSIPIESRPGYANFTPEQVELIMSYYNSVPKVIGIVLQGRQIDESIQRNLISFSQKIIERPYPVDSRKRGLTISDPLIVGKAKIHGDHDISGNFRGLAVNRSGHIFTADRNKAVILKLNAHGEILAKSEYQLPDYTVLDRISNVYVDRNDWVIALDEFPGFIAFYDDSLDFADLKKLPGELPGGVAGISGIVRDNQNNFFTINDSGDLLQKFDRDFNLIKWTAGTSYRPGYFVEPYDMGIGPRQSIYVVDRTKPYVQKFTPNLELETIISLPLKDTFFNPIPLYVTIDDAGSIYVAEKRTRNVYRYSPAAELVGYFQLPSEPEAGIVVTPDGIFYTIMNNHIVSYDLKQETPKPDEDEEEAG